MQPAQTRSYTCQACGHTIQADAGQISRQPTCPRCRTYGKLTEQSAPAQPRRIARPGARPAPANPDDPVVVRADVAYGAKRNTKSIINAVVLIVLGISMIATLAFIATSMQEDAVERERARKEVVQDPQDYERAITESVNRVRRMLENVANAEATETMDFAPAIKIIEQAGGAVPSWSEPPRPGNPVRAVGFMLTGMHDTKQKVPDAGFVVLLYYKTAAEVEQAASQIKGAIGADTRTFGLKVNPAMWYVAYSGNAYSGRIFDALKSARDMGEPSTFKQFTDRVGSTYRGENN